MTHKDNNAPGSTMEKAAGGIRFTESKKHEDKKNDQKDTEGRKPKNMVNGADTEAALVDLCGNGAKSFRFVRGISGIHRRTS